jgi:transcriptional regulator with XRE-family HTH domain
MTPRDASGRLLTEGRRLLCAVVARSKGAEVTRELRVSQPYLSRLMSGERRPSLDQAIRLRDAYGIPCESWRLETA